VKFDVLGWTEPKFLHYGIDSAYRMIQSSFKDRYGTQDEMPFVRIFNMS